MSKATITAAQVQSLREQTNAGFMDCKRALVESGGDAEGAMLLLRLKGAEKATGKASRETREGVVFFHGDTMAEILCETDFVAKNESFLEFAREAVESLDKTGTIPEDRRQKMVQMLGENIRLGSFVTLHPASGESIATYRHSPKLGVILLTRGATPDAAREICLQIAFGKPLYLSSDELQIH